MPYRDHALLFLKDVQQAYPDDGGMKTVINGINAIVMGHEFITLLGPSGSGKSTLLRMMLGSEMPHHGQCFFEGKEVRGPDRYRGIVFQRYSMFPFLTTQESVAQGVIWEETTLPQRKLYLPEFLPVKERAMKMAAQMLDQMGLGDHLKKKPDMLSGGQRQRAAIAQALVMKPKLLLMDEPFGALDVIVREQMQELIIRLYREYNMSIVFVTHDVDEALYLGTRIWVISQHYKGEPHHGAKLVADMPFDEPHGPERRESRELPILRRQVMHDLKPGNVLDPRNLNLIHRYAIRETQGEEA